MCIKSMYLFFLRLEKDNLLDLLTRLKPLNNTEVCLFVCDLAPVTWAPVFQGHTVVTSPWSPATRRARFQCLQYHSSPRLLQWSRYSESPPSHPAHTLFPSHSQTKSCLKCFCDGRSLTTSAQRVIPAHLEFERYLLQLVGGFSRPQ